MYVPTSDLDAVLGMEKRGVLLPRSQFEELLKKAAQNARETPDIPNGITVVSADYQGRIVGSQLLLAATIKLNQVVDGWRFLRLPLEGIGLESAALDGSPALLGANGADRTLHLFSDRRGAHTLVLEAAVPLVASGGDREANFRLGDLPVGTLNLEVAANQRLLLSGHALERPSPLDKPATYSLPIGGPAEIKLRLTDRSLEQASDRLLFAETTYRLNVSYGDAAWQAATSLDARGTAVEHLMIVIPEGLQITAVDSTGLNSWKASAAAPQKPATLELSYRQAFKGPRTIQFRGVLRPGADRRWHVEALKIQGVTTHVGRLEIVHPPDLRLRIESAANVRTAPVAPAGAGAANASMPPASELDALMPPAPNSAQANAANRPAPRRPIPPSYAAPLSYDAWNEQFSLAFAVEAKQRDVRADLLTSVEVSSSGLQLQLAASLESLNSPVFDVELTLPAEWIPTAVLLGTQPVEWRELSAEAGTQHLLVTLPKPVSPGVRVPLTLSAQRSVSNWPIDEAGVDVALPEVRVLNSAAIAGSYVIRAGDDFELTPLDVKGLDPAHLNLERERIGYRYQDTRFSGQVKIARRPARLSAETILVARLDRAALRTHVRTAIEARGGGFRRLDIFLPESVSKDVRFQTDNGEVAIADQSVSEPARGERHWSLVFARYVQGAVHLQTLIDTPRGDAKEFRIPEPRLDGVARHSGTVVVQAAPDQQLQVTAMGADNQPLREVDQADLPPLPNKSDDRTVAAYRFVQPGNRVTLTETRYAPVGVARAVCTRCTIQTVVPVSGECQHTAAFQFLASGVQNLRLLLPEGADLWATLIDGQPVEVRRGQSAYELPLKPGPDPDSERVLTVFYATPAPAGSKAAADEARTSEANESPDTLSSESGLGANPRFQQSPPEVSVVGSAGTPERMEVLHRTWTLHYPSDLTVAESQGAFRPATIGSGIGLLTRLVRDLGAVSATDVGWKLLEFFAVVVVVWLCVRGYSRWGAKGIATACVAVAVIASLWLATMLASSREYQSATYLTSEAPATKSVATSDSGPAFAHAYNWNKSVGGRPPVGGIGGLGVRAPAAPNATESGNDGVRLQDDVGFFEKESAAAEKKAAAASLRSHTVRNKGDEQSGARLSVPIGFEPQQNSSNRSFEYIGRESVDSQPPLIDVQFESLAGRRVFCGAIVAIVTFVLWILRRRSWGTKGAIGALGLLLPIALAGVVPVRFEAWLDGIFLGTLCGVATWLLYELPGTLGSLNRRTPAAKSTSQRHVNAAGTAVLLAALLMAPSSARSDEGETGESKSSRAIVAPVPKPSSPAVIPYDPDHNPTAADRVLLEQRTFLELWNRAHPERPLGAHPLPDAFVTEAVYKASLVSDSTKPAAGATSDRGQVSITGHVALYSRADRPVSVALPFQEAALKSANLDGKSALLIPHSHDTDPQQKAQKSQPHQYDVVLQSPGAHVLDVELEVPARVAGPSGEFTLGLLPVASGRLSFELPPGASSVRINGADAGFRRRADGSKEWIDVPIASAGNLTIAWQPAQEAGSVARSIESTGKTLLVLDDAGLRTVSQFSLQIRQGGVSELSFGLPPNSKLKDIRGSDVAGWKLEGNDLARKLIVSLRRSVTGTTEVELDLFQPLAVGEAPVSVSAALPAPLGVVRETGTVALTAGPQFDVRGPNLAGGTRIDAREFDLPNFSQRPELQPVCGGTIEAAFRYAAHPAGFELSVARRSSQTDVAALYAVLVGRRKLTLSSQFHVQPAGSALTRAQFRLPAGFLVLAVEGVPLADWYVIGVAGAKSLIVELATPQSAPFDLVINGTVAKNPDDAKTALDVPILSAARRAEAHMAVWLDGSYQATIGEAGDWKSISPDQTPSAMKSLVAAPPQFAFETRRAEPTAVSLTLAHAVARLSGDSATIVTVTDAAVFYTVALQWTITQATADTFVLTMPDWLASRLDLTDPQTVSGTNPRRRQTVSTALANGRVRWTIELQDPVADQLFLTATAVLPLPKDGKIDAPTLGFESEEAPGGEHRPEPLATQRHFLVLVNQSTGQLSDAPGNPIEAVDRGALPIQLDGNLLKQAMQVGRLTRADATASWRLDRPAVRRGAAAFVNLADLVTVVEQGGTWRTQATYRVKNLSRQFLAVEIPEGSEILSVTVQRKPARAVRATVKGKAYNLIPLPEVSEGDLSFEVQLVVAGRLAEGPLPEGGQLFGGKVPLVAPQVVTWEADADYGIPVARTRWTVWFPQDEQVRVLTSSQDTNLDRADENSASVFERSVLLDEARQLLSVVESGKSENSAQLAYGNLRQLDKQLSESGSAVWGGSTSRLSSEVEVQAEQSVLQRMKDVRQRAEGGQNAQKAGQEAPQSARPLTPETQSAQARDLLERNENSKVGGKAKSGEARGEFGFRAPTGTGSGNDKSPFPLNLPNKQQVEQDRQEGQESKEEASKKDKASAARQSNEDETFTEPKPAADLEKQFDALNQESRPQSLNEGFKKIKRKQPQSTLGLGQFGAPVFSSTGQGAPAPAPPQAPGDQTLAPAKEEAARPRSPGTLSLAFEIPKEGQMLVFTKAGGDPKLTVELRPRRSLELLLGTLWMLPWLFLLLLALILFGRNRYSPAAWRQFPFGLIAVGLLLFVCLPAPASLTGLALVAAGTIQASVRRHRQAAGR